jgi:thiol-disulfide isomerase/thioredoxin
MKKTIWIYVIVLVVAIGGIYYVSRAPSGPGPLDEFATCIKDSGTKFYGAFWCPHCQATKKMFGTSAKLLPYIECSTPDGSSQNDVCNKAKIESYPTWEFKGGTRITGEQSLSTLAEKTSCTLPAGYK